MVEAMDESVGKIITKLETLNLSENTLILFTSDNGGLTLDGITSNYPLRGGKSFAYEGGTRVPFIASWKNKIEPNQTNDTRIIGTDIYPTILAAAQIPLDFDQHKDGKNLLPLILGKESLTERPLYFHFPHYTHATSPFSSIIDGDYKLIRYYNDAEGKYALFNIQEDVGETIDLSDSYPDLVKKLDNTLTSLLEGANAEYPIPVTDKLGIEKIDRYYKGETIGFSTKGVANWLIRNKKTERILSNMERNCFKQWLKGEDCEFVDFQLLSEKSKVDLEKLAPFME